MLTENEHSGNAATLASTELQPIFTGPILIEGDADYEVARKVWNGMIDRRPSIIAQCKNVNDISSAVKFARKHNLLVSIKGGGHNVTGNAVCDNGMMIDLSLMKAVNVDAVKMVAKVEMGATWGDFDKATQQYELGSTGGLITSTGVAGLTLGGGVGWLVRKHGLSCDNVIAAQIVNKDGEIVSANLEENADLLWGLRGGGGNFGVVASMDVRLHKLGTVLGGMLLYTRDKAKDVLHFYRQFIKTAPEELTLYAGLLTSPDGIPIIAVIGCYSGDLEEGEKVLKPLREFGTPMVDLIQPMPYVQMQSLLDGGFPHGNRYYWKSGFVQDLSDEAIDVIVSQAAAVPSPYTAIILEYYGGAAAREPEGGTAYPHRDALFDLVIISNWVDAQDDNVNIGWTKTIWQAMEKHLSNKVYVNALGVEGQERVREAYGKNYERLAELKRKYDPDNFFRMNQNIIPG
jgi:FAD/FMN-containing dehydrogenase